jgi:hypothetical protein
MRKKVLTTAIVTSAILLTAMMQYVLAQESLLDNSINQSGKWSFSFNKGDKLTGVLSCTAGSLDLLIWLNDGTAMHRQRAWEGGSVAFSWVIPSTGDWTVEVFDAQAGTCLGWIKLDVERVTGGFGLALDPIWRTVLLGIIAVTVAAIIGVVGYALFQKLKKPRKSSTTQNFDPEHTQLHSCAPVRDGWSCSAV